uniref:Uncharacterized protein n=1 Tax=Anguilla anguilla TaxID=7936 RepID=A0A0E9RHF6_ANGAN
MVGCSSGQNSLWGVVSVRILFCFVF